MLKIRLSLRSQVQEMQSWFTEEWVEPWTMNQQVLTTQGSLGVSSFLWRLMASIFASLLVLFISPSLSVPSSFFCFSMQVAQHGALPHRGHLSLSLRSANTWPTFWNLLFISLGWGGRGACEIIDHNYGCLDPWEVQCLKHGAWGLDPETVSVIKNLKNLSELF